VSSESLAATSAYRGRMTTSRACAIIKDAIRTRHDRAENLQLTSLIVDPQHFEYVCIVWGGDKVGWNPKKSVSIDIEWDAVTAIGVNEKRTDAGDSVYSIWFKFKAQDARRIFNIGSCRDSRYQPADVMLALKVLTEQKPVGVQSSGLKMINVKRPRVVAPQKQQLRPQPAVVPSEKDDAEARLLRLRALYQKGLISESVYENEQRKLLKQL